MDAPLYALVWQSDEAETSTVLPRRGKTSVPGRNKLRQDPQNLLEFLTMTVGPGLIVFYFLQEGLFQIDSSGSTIIEDADTAIS